jgi:hypothetical protein
MYKKAPVLELLIVSILLFGVAFYFNNYVALVCAVLTSLVNFILITKRLINKKQQFPNPGDSEQLLKSILGEPNITFDSIEKKLLIYKRSVTNNSSPSKGDTIIFIKNGSVTGLIKSFGNSEIVGTGWSLNQEEEISNSSPI